MQTWRRLGHIYNAMQESAFLFSHASYPTTLVLDRERVRIFFSPRDAQNRSSIIYLDLAIDGDKHAIVSPPSKPLLFPGRRGAFDDSGVTVSCVVRDNDRLLVYYLGWSLSVTVPFRNFIGLAMGPADGSTLTRVSEAPVVERSEIDPLTLGYPWVLRVGQQWRMWYGSHLLWGKEGLDMHHVIKDASSEDGVSWRREGHIALGLAGDEFAVSRPCVLHEDGVFHMWYSRRSPGYSLGYATSGNGLDWTRHENALRFSGPVQSWENESMEYATVFDINRRRYMLYNGNGYGRSGFGLAVLEG